MEAKMMREEGILKGNMHSGVINEPLSGKKINPLYVSE